MTAGTNRDRFAAKQGRVLVILSGRGIGLAINLYGMIDEVDDPIFGNGRTRINRQFQLTVQSQRSVGHLDHQAHRRRIRIPICKIIDLAGDQRAVRLRFTAFKRDRRPILRKMPAE